MSIKKPGLFKQQLKQMINNALQNVRNTAVNTLRRLRLSLRTKLRILLYCNVFLFLFLIYTINLVHNDIEKSTSQAKQENDKLEDSVLARIRKLGGNLANFQERIYKDFTNSENLILIASNRKVEKDELHDAIIKATQKSKHPVVIINNSDVKYIKVNDFIEKTHLYENENADIQMKRAIRTLSREKGVILVAAPAILTSSDELDYTDFLVDTYLKLASSE